MNKKTLLIAIGTTALIAGLWCDALATKREHIRRAGEEEAKAAAAAIAITEKRRARIELGRKLAYGQMTLREAIDSRRQLKIDGETEFSDHELADGLIYNACAVLYSDGEKADDVERFRRKLTEEFDKP